jgi:hypothetical protein
MEIALQIIAIVLSLLLFWTGIKRFDMSRQVATSLEVLNALVLVAFTLLLGWLGIALALVTVGIMILAFSIHLAIEHDRHITHANALSGISKEDLRTLSKRLQHENRAVKTLGPIRTAALLRYLTDCSRKLDEMEPMAKTIATLWFAHNLMEETEIKTLTRKFDQLLRLWRKPATESMDAADMLTCAVKTSPTTFMEMLDGMIGVSQGDEAYKVGRL